jgi:hypothetical protein
VLKAFYIGSDYTYAYSEKFRENIFRDNTLDDQLLVGVKIRPEPNIPVAGDNNGDDEANNLNEPAQQPTSIE